MNEPFTDAQHEHVEAEADLCYTDFVERVAEGRDMTIEATLVKCMLLAGARVPYGRWPELVSANWAGEISPYGNVRAASPETVPPGGAAPKRWN